MDLGEEENVQRRAGDAKAPLVEPPDERADGEKEGKRAPPPPAAFSTLQRSSFAFLPAAVVTLAHALTGTRLLLSHAWTCGVFALSVANHSRDYRDGPRLDALDAADKVFAWALGASCFADGLVHLSRWRFWTGSSLGAATLALYCATRFLKTAAAEDTSLATALRVRSTFPTAELAHVCMHLTAGLGALIVVA